MRLLCIRASLVLLSPLALFAQVSGDPATFVKKGVAQNAKGDYNGALDSFNRALEIDSQNWNALEGRGESHLGQGDLTDAIDDFTKALSLVPDDRPSLYHRAIAESRNGAFDAAISDFDQLVHLDQMSAAQEADIFVQRGSAKFSKGNADGALSDASQAVMMAPANANAAFLRGIVGNAKGQYAQAAQDFSRAAQGGIAEAALWFWLAKAENKQQDDGNTQLPLLMAKATARHPDPWLAELANLLLQKTTNMQVAFDMGRLPSAAGDKAAQGWFFVGVSREFNADKSGAKEAYQKAIDLGTPDNYRTAEARRRIKILSS